MLKRYVIVFLRFLNHEDGYEKKLFKYSFLYFIIIIMNTLVALSSQAVYGMHKCNLCGVGEYKKLYNYSNTAGKDLERQPLLFAEGTQNFESDGPKASKEKENFEKSFVKCTHCASLLCINSLSDQLNSLVIGKSSVLWRDALCCCINASCGLGVLGAGVSMYCALQGPTPCVYAVVPTLCSCASCVCCVCFAAINIRRLCRHRPDDEDSALIDHINEQIQRNVTDKVEVVENQPQAGVHLGALFVSDSMETIFKEQISACYDSFPDEKHRPVLSKDAIMILALYEKWNVKTSGKVVKAVCGNVRKVVWNSLYAEIIKGGSPEKIKALACIFSEVTHCSSTMLYSHVSRVCGNNSGIKNKDSNEFKVSMDHFTSLLNSDFPGSSILHDYYIKKLAFTDKRDSGICDSGIYNSSLVSYNGFGCLSFLRDCLRFKYDVGSFIISLSLNKLSMQMLFCKVDDYWEIYYPQLFGDVCRVVTVDGFERIVSSLMDYCDSGDSNMNSPRSFFTKVELIIPEVFKDFFEKMHAD
ncbi:MAG: hypothetical protein QS721_07910 [Candidatus Endonucleobacter sp. (ex Gigantidas childressi)]|nr:hypothetical protein [Candidatus Endonucleobacter sp. (ex Gigantidas childressi)]